MVIPDPKGDAAGQLWDGVVPVAGSDRWREAPLVPTAQVGEGRAPAEGAEAARRT